MWKKEKSFTFYYLLWPFFLHFEQEVLAASSLFSLGPSNSIGGPAYVLLTCNFCLVFFPISRKKKRQVIKRDHGKLRRFHMFSPPFCSSQGHRHQLFHPRILLQRYLLGQHFQWEAANQGKERGREGLSVCLLLGLDRISLPSQQ